MQPLREDWANVEAAATQLDDGGDRAAAVALIERFLTRLTQVRVLDPACGSGNFLYVTLEHLKRLEGEVLDALRSFDAAQVGWKPRYHRRSASAAGTRNQPPGGRDRRHRALDRVSAVAFPNTRQRASIAAGIEELP